MLACRTNLIRLMICRLLIACLASVSIVSSAVAWSADEVEDLDVTDVDAEQAILSMNDSASEASAPLTARPLRRQVILATQRLKHQQVPEAIKQLFSSQSVNILVVGVMIAAPLIC